MSDRFIKSNLQAKEVLQRASCIALVLEQTFVQAQIEEPFCTSALAEVLAQIKEMIEQVIERFDVLELDETLS